MKYRKGNEIRQMWLDFFKEKGHAVEKGASLIPNDDPTLLWMNAGVAALKKYFDGRIVPKNPRIVNAQKCIRTNDIENVGKTARHHTFFEMLGNFSIGDYFREEAIAWAFELLTEDKWFGMDKDDLYITVYPTDEESKKHWIEQGIDPGHIIPTEEGNFWEIGSGPCGPCTEVYFDRGPDYGESRLDAIRNDEENDRYVEIWNIVFSQYNAIPGVKRDHYPELPKKNIDTGCGLERLASVIQDAKTNFETDFFMPIIEKIADISDVTYTGQMSFKVIADHIRTVVFAVADGAILGNEGRGYVLRRLLRRAVKHGRNLGIEKPFLKELVSVVVDIMKSYYDYLPDRQELIEKIVDAEERKFLQTLAEGERKFKDIAVASDDKKISGKDAFLLYDTYGFPVELTVEYADDIDYDVDLPGFEKEMEKQRERARKARKNEESMTSQKGAFLDFTAESMFIGYEKMVVDTTIIKVFDEGVVLRETPFYATSGGQVNDTGILKNDNFKARVVDVEKMPNGQYLHIIETEEGNLKEGMDVHAEVNKERRQMIARHHSVTHLLFRALRDKLGGHVSQQGSRVAADSLRFDFNHFESVDDDTILEVESRVKEMIGEPYDVTTKIMPIDEARKQGAIAEFGEKYEGEVRVVDLKYSLDLCGGTHVDNISDIGDFAVVSIYSIGSGIYRIEAVADGETAHIIDRLSGMNEDLDNLKTKAKSIITHAKKDGFSLDVSLPEETKPVGSYQDVINRRKQLEETQQAVKELEKTYNRKKKEKAMQNTDEFLTQAEDNVLVTKVEGMDIPVVKQLVDNLFEELDDGVVLMASVFDGKVVFICKSGRKDVHAGKLVKTIASICGGGGGGRPDFAQAGGKDVSKVDEALNKAKELIG